MVTVCGEQLILLIDEAYLVYGGHKEIYQEPFRAKV